MSARYQLGNHHNDCLLDKLHESAYKSVVYFNMENILLYWSMDRYNNVQKWVEREEGAMLPDGRKGLILRHHHRYLPLLDICDCHLLQFFLRNQWTVMLEKKFFEQKWIEITWLTKHNKNYFKNKIVVYMCI